MPSSNTSLLGIFKRANPLASRRPVSGTYAPVPSEPLTHLRLPPLPSHEEAEAAKALLEKHKRNLFVRWKGDSYAVRKLVFETVENDQLIARTMSQYPYKLTIHIDNKIFSYAELVIDGDGSVGVIAKDDKRSVHLYFYHIFDKRRTV